MKRLIALCAFLLVGCDSPVVDKWEPDQKVRQQIFKDCLATVPEGPRRTVSNDWAEVVDECGEQAYYQSLTKVSK